MNQPLSGVLTALVVCGSLARMQRYRDRRAKGVENRGAKRRDWRPVKVKERK